MDAGQWDGLEHRVQSRKCPGSNSGDLAKGFHFSESQEAHRVSISLGVGEDWCPRGNPSLFMGLSFLIFKMAPGRGVSGSS